MLTQAVEFLMTQVNSESQRSLSPSKRRQGFKVCGFDIVPSVQVSCLHKYKDGGFYEEV
jgi:hypothetical protein